MGEEMPQEREGNPAWPMNSVPWETWRPNKTLDRP